MVCFRQAYPIFEATMSRKTKVAYKAVFERMKEIFHFRGLELVMADYEDAIRGAISESFPGVQVAGCLFHFDRVRFISI